MSKLVRAIVKNLKGVDEIDIHFGDVTNIAGDEGTGKSSFVDGVLWAFQGTRPIQGKPIRDGEMAAQSIVETDKLLITREYTKDKSEKGYHTTLKIKGKDGGTYNQSYLNEIFPNLVDPTAFFNMSDAEIRKMLIGFLSEEEQHNLAVINKQLGDCEEERLSCSRTLKKMGVPEEVEEVESVSFSELIAQRDEILKFNATQEELTRKEFAHNEVIDIRKKLIQDTREEIEKLETTLDTHEQKLKELEGTEIGIAAKPKSTEELDAQIDHAEETNVKATAYQRYLSRKTERDQLEKDHEGADTKIKELRNLKKVIMAEATLPGDNPIEITEDDVLVNNRPMDQLSTSEKILFSAELAMAHNDSPDDNGRIRTLVIRHGESLGTKTYDKLCALRETYNYQLLIESVGDGHSSDAIILEEGKVK